MLARGVDSGQRPSRAQREDPRPRQKMKEQRDLTTVLSFRAEREISPIAEREISPKGRNDKEGVEVTKRKNWIPD